MNKLITQVLPLAGALFLSSSIMPAYAEGYYRWLGKDGVVHYGSRPPTGVNAELINTWGKSAGKSTPFNARAQAKTTTSRMTAKEQKLRDERQQQCEDERGRLKALQSTGRRIIMQQEDGSSRHLTPEEVTAEIASSKEYVKKACQ